MARDRISIVPNKVDPAFERQCGERFHRAYRDFNDKAGVYPKWLQTCRHTPDAEEFFAALQPIYERDHNELLTKMSTEMLTALMDLTRATGVRFASIGMQDFITLENVCDGPWPVAWSIITTLDRYSTDKKFHAGCGNGNQAQVSVKCYVGASTHFPCITSAHMGVYDLRQDRMERLCEPLTLRSRHSDNVSRPYRGGDLSAYLRAAGAIIPEPFLQEA